MKKQLSLVAESVLSAADIIRPVVSSKQRGKKTCHEIEEHGPMFVALRV